MAAPNGRWQIANGRPAFARTLGRGEMAEGKVGEDSRFEISDFREGMDWEEWGG